MDIELLKVKSYIEISKYRGKVVRSIGEDVKTPTNIAKECNIRTNHISNVLRDLKEHNIVECINEEMRKGRLYRLTEKGLEIHELIKNEVVL